MKTQTWDPKWKKWKSRFKNTKNNQPTKHLPPPWQSILPNPVSNLNVLNLPHRYQQLPTTTWKLASNQSLSPPTTRPTTWPTTWTVTTWPHTIIHLHTQWTQLLRVTNSRAVLRKATSLKNQCRSKTRTQWWTWCTANNLRSSSSLLKSRSWMIRILRLHALRWKELRKSLMRSIPQLRCPLILLISFSPFMALNSKTTMKLIWASKDRASTINRKLLLTITLREWCNNHSSSSLILSSRRTTFSATNTHLAMILLINSSRVHWPKTSNTTHSQTTKPTHQPLISLISQTKINNLMTSPSSTFLRRKWWTRLSMCLKILDLVCNSNNNNLLIKRISHHSVLRICRSNVHTSHLRRSNVSTSHLHRSNTNTSQLSKSSNVVTSHLPKNNHNLRISRLSLNDTSVSVRNLTVLGWSSVLTVAKAWHLHNSILVHKELSPMRDHSLP